MKENTHNPHPLRFMVFLCFLSALVATELWQIKASNSGADLGGGFRGCAPTPLDDLRFSNTTGILPKKKTMWFIGVEVEQETSAPTPKKNPGSASEISYLTFFPLLHLLHIILLDKLLTCLMSYSSLVTVSSNTLYILYSNFRFY